LTSEAAQHIFEKSKNRLFQLTPISPADLKDIRTDRQDILQELSAITHTLKPVLDVPPKWQLFLQVMDEIKQDFESRSQKPNLSQNGDAQAGAYRILVIVKDARTSIQLRELMKDGIDKVLHQRHRWLVSQLCADIRAKAKFGQNRRSQFGSNSGGNSGSYYSYNRANKAAQSYSSSSSSSSNSSSSASSSSDPAAVPVLDIGLTLKQFKSLNLESKLLLLHVRNISFNFKSCCNALSLFVGEKTSSRTSRGSYQEGGSGQY
jgi:hypothetical protein